MAWIEVHQSLRDHRKILALADELDMPEVHVAGHCLYLWLWSLDNAPDGLLPASHRIIARAAGWTGDPGIFVMALVRVKLLNQSDDGTLYIHDWDEYAGKLIDRRKADAEKHRAWRDRKKSDVIDTSTSRPDDVTVMSPSRPGATVQYPTVPNSTLQHHSGSSPFSVNGYQKSSSSKGQTERILRTESAKRAPARSPTTTAFLKNIDYAEQARWVADVPDDLQLSWTVSDRRDALEKMLTWCKEKGHPPSEMRYHQWLKDERNHVPDNATEVEKLERILLTENKETGKCSNGQTYTNNLGKLREARQREKAERAREAHQHAWGDTRDSGDGERDTSETGMVYLEPGDTDTSQ